MYSDTLSLLLPLRLILHTVYVICIDHMIYNTIYTHTIYDRCGNPNARNYQYSIAIAFPLYNHHNNDDMYIHIYTYDYIGMVSKYKPSDNNVIPIIILIIIPIIIPIIWYSHFNDSVFII